MAGRRGPNRVHDLFRLDELEATRAYMAAPEAAEAAGGAGAIEGELHTAETAGWADLEIVPVITSAEAAASVEPRL